MAEFVRIEDKNGKVMYRNKTENKVVAADALPVALKEELDIAEPGTVIDEETITQGEGDGVVDKDGNKVEEEKTEEPETIATPLEEDEADEPAANPYERKVPATEEGFGFPRKNGKTVDIFDGKTPHTHVRPIEGFAVPLSEENYKTKTDAELYDRLRELKMI